MKPEIKGMNPKDLIGKRILMAPNNGLQQMPSEVLEADVIGHTEDYIEMNVFNMNGAINHVWRLNNSIKVVEILGIAQTQSPVSQTPIVNTYMMDQDPLIIPQESSIPQEYLDLIKTGSEQIMDMTVKMSKIEKEHKIVMKVMRDQKLLG